jgi:serine/threonine-protein kinase HipA
LNSPAEIVRLLDMVIFNVLACNTDAHAKNYAIMIRAGSASLAPMYDVMCGEVWENVTKNFAQHIGDERRGDRLEARHWQQFGRRCGLNPKQVVGRVEALANAVIAEAERAASEVAAMPGGSHESLDLARQAVERRSLGVLAQLGERQMATATVPEEDASPPALVVTQRSAAC